MPNYRDIREPVDFAREILNIAKDGERYRDATRHLDEIQTLAIKLIANLEKLDD